MIDRKKVREVLAECEAALAPIAEKHGLNLVRKTCTFRPNEMPVAFRFEAPVERSGVELTTEQAAFMDNAERWGIGHIKLGDEIKVNGKTFTIAGAKPRRRKYPIIALRSDGKQFKLALQTVRFGHRCAVGDL